VTLPPFSKEFLARYELREPLGEGGVAEVFLARQLELDRICAVKAFQPSVFDGVEGAERFLDEGRVLAKLHHPNIVQVYDSGRDGELFFLVLELIDGSDLKQEIARRVGRRKSGALSPRKALQLCAEVADALAAAHEMGVVHRDLKPENILLDKEGTPKVVDFGFARFDAKVLDRSYKTQEGVILGTPYYIAPEIIRDQEITPAADLYALGIILYECLVGLPPFMKGNDTAVLVAHTRDPIPPVNTRVPDLPAQLDDLIQWCCKKDPTKRPRSASRLARALREAHEKVPTWSSRVGRLSSSRLQPVYAGADTVMRRTRVARSAAFGAGLVGILGLAYLLVPRAVSPPQHVSVTPCIRGFVARWDTEAAQAGRLSFRSAGDPESTWSELPENQPSLEHEVVVQDLSPGRYQVAIVHGGTQTPAPEVQVRPLKYENPRVEARKEGDGFLVEFRTAFPVRASVTPGPPPDEESWSTLGEQHTLFAEVRPDEAWQAPVIHLRDIAGEVLSEPLGRPLVGWRRAARDLATQLRSGQADVAVVASELEQRAETLRSDGEDEIRRIERRIRSNATVARPNQHRHEAIAEYLASQEELFLAVLEDRPALSAARRFSTIAGRYWTDPQVLGREKLELLALLAEPRILDDLAEAIGAPPPLGIRAYVQDILPILITPPDRVDARLAELRNMVGRGRGAELFHGSAIEETTHVLPELHLLQSTTTMMLVKEATENFYRVDLDTAPKGWSGTLRIPESAGPRPRHLALHGFNLNPFLRIRGRITPVAGGPPVSFVFHNTDQGYPGTDAYSHVEVNNDQVHEAVMAAWMLPPGEYRVQLQGEHVPGRVRALAWSFVDILVTW
jgi:serine/threonine-protein kinase